MLNFLLLTLAFIGYTLFIAGVVQKKNILSIFLAALFTLALTQLSFLEFGIFLVPGSGGSEGYLPQLMDILGDNVYQQLPSLSLGMIIAISMLVLIASTAERMRLSALIIFSLLQGAIFLPVMFYWNWYGGFIQRLGFVDFAGAGAVHLVVAVQAFAAVLLLGPRRARYADDKIQAIGGGSLAIVGASSLIIWFGAIGLYLFGFELQGQTSEIINWLTVIVAQMAAVVAVLFINRIIFANFDFSLAINGLLAAVVMCSAVGPNLGIHAAAILGVVAGLLSFYSILIFDKLKLDDPVGAIASHGLPAVVGLLIAPYFGEATIVNQLLGISVIIIVSFVGSFIAWWVIKKLFGQRVLEKYEQQGLDITFCAQKSDF